MKTILLIFAIWGAVIITLAQESNTDKIFQQKMFNTETINDSNEYSVYSTILKTDTSSIKIMQFRQLPGDSYMQNNQGKIEFFANGQKPEFRMPVASGGVHHYFNMPVFVPDSTVKYYIKNKQVDYVNPLEKR